MLAQYEARSCQRGAARHQTLHRPQCGRGAAAGTPRRGKLSEHEGVTTVYTESLLDRSELHA